MVIPQLQSKGAAAIPPTVTTLTMKSALSKPLLLKEKIIPTIITLTPESTFPLHWALQKGKARSVIISGNYLMLIKCFFKLS